MQEGTGKKSLAMGFEILQEAIKQAGMTREPRGAKGGGKSEGNERQK